VEFHQQRQSDEREQMDRTKAEQQEQEQQIALLEKQRHDRVRNKQRQPSLDMRASAANTASANTASTSDTSETTETRAQRQARLFILRAATIAYGKATTYTEFTEPKYLRLGSSQETNTIAHRLVARYPDHEDSVYILDRCAHLHGLCSHTELIPELISSPIDTTMNDEASKRLDPSPC
jgi:hypothetical protein